MTTEPVTKVLVVYTGGTIGMVPCDPANPASPLTPAPKERLGQYVPNPLGGGIAWDLVGLVDENSAPVGPLDSSSVGPKHWGFMAQAIADGYDAYDGFVVLHGTDTMAYTGSALAFLLQNLAKPVVVTGAQRPIFQPGTDAVRNVVNALTIAGYKASGLPRIAEVTICFGDVLLRACRATKVSTSAERGFDSPNDPPLGAVGARVVVDRAALRPPPADTARFVAHTTLADTVAIVTLYPGMGGAVLRHLLGLDGVKGYILRCFGAGNAPEDQDFLAALAEATAAGKILVNTTQCREGAVEMGAYAASCGLMQAGLLTGLDLTAEAALAKLTWLLATHAGPDVAAQMQVDQRGEQSGSVFDLRFGPIGGAAQPVAVHTCWQRPAGQFALGTLTSAVLRLTGVGFSDTQDGEDVALKVFVNLPGATGDTPTTVPHFAGAVAGVYRGPDKTALLCDVTATLGNVQETGRPVAVTLVAPAGKTFWAAEAHLRLVTANA